MGAKLPVFLVRDPSNDYFPLSLGLLRAKLMASDIGGELVFFGNLNQSVEDVLRAAQAFGPGVWLFSDYVWSVKRNLALSQAIKEINPQNLVIHGGPSLPKYPDAFTHFVEENPSIDLGVRGEGEEVLLGLFRELLCTGSPTRPASLETPGLTWRAPGGDWIRNPDAPRQTQLDALPSPYLSGLFDKVPGTAWIVESNRGCPYSCSFCDWGSLTAQKIKKFELQRVKDELTWGAKRGLEILFLADANFGIFERDLEIAEHIGEVYRRYGFPTECNVTFAKNANLRVVEILRAMTRSGVKVDGNVAIQTTDTRTLRAVGRQNLSSERYEELIELFQEDGIPPSTDLMVCLPGQTVTSFQADLQKYLDRDIGLLIHHTYVLPNSPMAHPDYLRDWELKLDEEGRVLSCSSFTEEQGKTMVALRNAYFLGEFYGFFRYIMRYLQWEHDIPCSSFLLALTESSGQWSRLVHREQLPHDFSLYATLRTAIQSLHTSGQELYSEVKSWVQERFEIPWESGLETAFLVNEAVLPSPALSYPRELSLKHDFVSYFQDRREGGTAPLCSYGPGSLRVNLQEEGRLDPRRRTTRDWVWELDSPLLRYSKNWRYSA